MGASKLFAGLSAPQPLKLDTQHLDAFLAKLLEAVKSTDIELQALREENAQFRAEIVSLRGAVQKSDDSHLQGVVAMLKEKVVVLEGKLFNMENKIKDKAEASALKEIRETAEAAARNANDLQAEVAQLKTDFTKQTKETKSMLAALQSQLTEQIHFLTDNKADKLEVAQISATTDNLVQVCDHNTSEMEQLKAIVREFMSKVDAAIAGKADVEDLKEKMGRMEVDDLINQLTHQLNQKLQRTNKELQELREDLDVILTMIMQDANIGAGMFKCLSCEKPVALHRPGPPPGSGREPIIIEGVDKNMYRANKDIADAGRYSPRWESSKTPDKRAAAASPTRRSSLGAAEKAREKTPQRRSMNRPSSAKVRSTVS
jgi:hypothetical protein